MNENNLGKYFLRIMFFLGCVMLVGFPLIWALTAKPQNNENNNPVNNNVHTVVFEYNGRYNTQKVEDGGCAKIPGSVFEVILIAGNTYAFDGWSLDGKTLVDPTEVAITGNTIYKAMFTRLYTVTFSCDNHEIISQAVREGECALVPNIPNYQTLTKNGIKYNFIGWTLDGKEVVEDVASVPVACDMVYGGLYAVNDYWETVIWRDSLETPLNKLEASKLVTIGEDLYYFELVNNKLCQCNKLTANGTWQSTMITIDECDLTMLDIAGINVFTDGESVFAYIYARSGGTRFYKFNDEMTALNYRADWNLGSTNVSADTWLSGKQKYCHITDANSSAELCFKYKQDQEKWVETPSAVTLPVVTEEVPDPYLGHYRHEYYWQLGSDNAEITIWQDSEHLYCHLQCADTGRQKCYYYRSDIDKWVEVSSYDLPEPVDYIWQNGEHQYYSHGEDQYEIVKGENVAKVWVGLSQFDGNHIWHYDGQTYYSDGSQHYELFNEYWYSPEFGA